jgi:hypothetical protein
MATDRFSRGLRDDFQVLGSVYALVLLSQAAFWNFFGFDRFAVQLYLAKPVRLSRVLAGKNLIAAILVVGEVTAVAAGCLLRRIPMSAGKIFET